MSSTLPTRAMELWTWPSVAAGLPGSHLAFRNERAAETLAAQPDQIVGFKTAHYWTRQPWDAMHTPWASVDAAVAAGERARKPVMVDFWPRPPERSYADLILAHLRPGDIHTHVF